MIRRRASLVLVIMAAAVLAPYSAALAQEDVPEPTLDSNFAGAGFGEQVIVSGTDWPPNSIVQVQTCGNLGLNGTSDCDQITTVQVGVNTAGSFAAVILIGNPPVPCPCVFQVTSQTSGLVKTLDFEVRGAAVNPDEPTGIVLPDRRLNITEARIEGSGPWTALFGARPNRTLVLTVANTGFVAVNNPSIVLGLGKGANPTGFVAPPTIERIEPGESVTVRVDLELPVFAIGTYAVVGSIPGFETPIEFRAESSHVPWLLLLIPVLILIQVGLLTTRNRVRDRLAKSERPPAPLAELEPAAPVEPQTAAHLAVIDLRDEEPIDVDAEWDDPVDDDVADTEADEPAETNASGRKLETIIGEELGSVFDEAFKRHDGSISDSDFRDLVIDLAATASGRVAERTELDEEERSLLDIEMADAVLGAFSLGPDATV